LISALPLAKLKVEGGWLKEEKIPDVSRKTATRPFCSTEELTFDITFHAGVHRTYPTGPSFERRMGGDGYWRILDRAIDLSTESTQEVEP
jgi:hypothetical protein